MTDEPPRGFGREEYSEEDGDRPHPLEAKGDAVRPLRGVVCEGAKDADADDLANEPAEIDITRHCLEINRLPEHVIPSTYSKHARKRASPPPRKSYSVSGRYPRELKVETDVSLRPKSPDKCEDREETMLKKHNLHPTTSDLSVRDADKSAFRHRNRLRDTYDQDPYLSLTYFH
jgi:hypothetical protein